MGQQQLHWMHAAAVAEIEEHVIKVGLLPLEWSRGDVQKGDLLTDNTRSPASGNERLWSAATGYPRVSRICGGEDEGAFSRRN